MHPYFSSFILNRDGDVAVYVQLEEQLVAAIQNGTFPPETRLPGSRQLAQLLNVHRKTVIQAYDELLAQGWLESRVGSGTFVARHLPVVQPKKMGEMDHVPRDPLQVAGFTLPHAPHLDREFKKPYCRYHLDDGFPDPRLAPLQELSRAYRTQLLMGNSYSRLGYDDPQGSLWLRDELAAYLNQTRGMRIGRDNILVTRGTIMGLYLACSGLLQPGDRVVAAVPGWKSAQIAFQHSGATLAAIGVDAYGMRTEELEQLCKKHPVRMVYVTSHHHYPTTVSLRADRRMELLTLSAKYGFIVFEDDYDYDFHYLNRPLSPLASADRSGNVLYCGSFTKTIAPAFRVGYLVGPANVIRQLSRLRRIVDRQGDALLDNAMAELLQHGSIQRHLRKSLRTYRQRRDVFCQLLQSELGQWLDFQVPEGGLAVWVKTDRSIDLTKLALQARQHDLYFSDGEEYRAAAGDTGVTRLGFASSSEEELQQCVTILRKLISGN